MLWQVCLLCFVIAVLQFYNSSKIDKVKTGLLPIICENFVGNLYTDGPNIDIIKKTVSDYMNTIVVPPSSGYNNRGVWKLKDRFEEITINYKGEEIKLDKSQHSSFRTKILTKLIEFEGPKAVYQPDKSTKELLEILKVKGHNIQNLKMKKKIIVNKATHIK